MSRSQIPVFMHEEVPTMLTVVEASKVLRISRNLAYQLVKEREIPSVRLGNTIRIPMAMLQSWIEDSSSTDGAS